MKTRIFMVLTAAASTLLPTLALAQPPSLNAALSYLQDKTRNFGAIDNDEYQPNGSTTHWHTEQSLSFNISDCALHLSRQVSNVNFFNGTSSGTITTYHEYRIPLAELDAPATSIS